MNDDISTTPRLNDQLCFALHTASRLIVKTYRPILDSFGLTYTQYVTLMVLWESDGIHVKALGERLHMDSGTLTPLLKRLERDGFVERKRDIEDERRVLIYLTEMGSAMRQHGAEIQAQVACILQDQVDMGHLKDQLVELIHLLSDET